VLFSYNFRPIIPKGYLQKRKFVNASVRYPLALAAVVLLFVLSGCDKKEKSAQEHNTSTATVTKEDNVSTASNRPSPAKDNRFVLTDHNGISHTVALKEKEVLFPDIAKPVIILYFFSTWSDPCQGEAPYLSDLQLKYKKEVAVLGILLHPDNYLEELDKFVSKNNLSYFISSGGENDAFAKAVTKRLLLPDMLPIPLTVIYHNGRYYKHYEGAVPIEMLVHDIKTLLK